MTKLPFFLLMLLFSTGTFATVAQNQRIEVLGWSVEGKFAFMITHNNPFQGFDASYYLVDLIDDSVLLQFDVAHQDESTAISQLKSRWQVPFQRACTSYNLKPVENRPLSSPFNVANKQYYLALESNKLLIKQDKNQKIITTNLHANTQIIDVYLSPHESRIAIIIKENHQIKIFGSNLLLGFN